jgi:hypothetical protein
VEIPQLAANTARKHKRVTFAKRRRIVMSQTECESPTGRDLLALLSGIARDCIINDDGLRQLQSWLIENARSEMPAVQFLREASDRVSATGILTSGQAVELHQAIERVVPATIRAEFTERRQAASTGDYEERRKAWQSAAASEPATERQLAYIESLGGHPPVGLTKAAASYLIDELKGDVTQPSARQLMVLRFWNRLDMANCSRPEIAAWLDRFYAADPLRKAAWTLYKLSHRDDGSQHDPSWVEIGAGEKYRRQIVRNRTIVFFVGLGFLLFCFVLWKIVKAVM